MALIMITPPCAEKSTKPHFPTIAVPPYQEAQCPTSSPCYSRIYPPVSRHNAAFIIAAHMLWKVHPHF